MLLDVVGGDGAAVEMKDEFYWDVPKDDRCRVYVSPIELTLGQLTDDWNELKRTGRGGIDAVPYALVWRPRSCEESVRKGCRAHRLNLGAQPAQALQQAGATVVRLEQLKAVAQ